MADRNYSNTAVEAELAVSVSDSDIYLQMTSVTGWPIPPFTIVLEPDSVGEEVCLVTNLAGNTATATRGYDGTSAIAHLSGSTVKHAATAVDFSEANTHINSTLNVHGIPDTAELETKAGAQTKADTAEANAEATAAAALAAHEADTTNVHGIPDTALLETQVGAQTKADAAEADANTYTDAEVAAALAAANAYTDVEVAGVIPPQGGNNGKFLSTDGTSILWVPPIVGPVGPVGPAGADGADGADGVDGEPGKFIASDTPPASPTVGTGWFDSTSGRTYVYYDSVWVEIGYQAVSEGGGVPGAAPVFISPAAPTYTGGPYVWFDISGGDLQIKYEDGL